MHMEYCDTVQPVNHIWMFSGSEEDVAIMKFSLNVLGNYH